MIWVFADIVRCLWDGSFGIACAQCVDPLEKRQLHGLFAILSLELVVCIVAIARMALLIHTIRLNDPWNSAVIANLR